MLRIEKGDGLLSVVLLPDSAWPGRTLVADWSRERGRTKEKDLDGLLAAVVDFLRLGNLLVDLARDPDRVLLLAYPQCTLLGGFVERGLERPGKRVVRVSVVPERAGRDGSHRVQV